MSKYLIACLLLSSCAVAYAEGDFTEGLHYEIINPA